MMEQALDILIAALIVLGGSFALIGSWGLARLPGLMARLHGPTKATTLGVGGCLIASMLYFPAKGMDFSVHELLVTLFLFITAPISANMVARAYLHERKVAEGRGTDEGSLTTRSVAMLNEPLRVADDPLEGREVVSVDGTEDGGSQLGVEGCGASSPLEGCDDILGELTRREGAVSWTVPLGE